jgi:hypothetical protein
MRHDFRKPKNLALASGPWGGRAVVAAPGSVALLSFLMEDIMKKILMVAFPLLCISGNSSEGVARVDALYKGGDVAIKHLYSLFELKHSLIRIPGAVQPGQCYSCLPACNSSYSLAKSTFDTYFTLSESCGSELSLKAKLALINLQKDVIAHYAEFCQFFDPNLGIKE